MIHLLFSLLGVNIFGEPIQDLGGLSFRGGYDVTVYVACGGGLGVTKVSGHDYQRGPIRNQEASVGV